MFALLFCCRFLKKSPIDCKKNTAIRFICCLKRRSHITPYLTKLGMLCIDQKIRFKSLTLVWKALNGLSPFILAEKTKTKDNFEPKTRQQHKLQFDIKENIKSRYYERTWNFKCHLFSTLPNDMILLQSYEKFKRELKKHLLVNRSL